MANDVGLTRFVQRVSSMKAFAALLTVFAIAVNLEFTNLPITQLGKTTATPDTCGAVLRDGNKFAFLQGKNSKSAPRRKRRGRTYLIAFSALLAAARPAS